MILDRLRRWLGRDLARLAATIAVCLAASCAAHSQPAVSPAPPGAPRDPFPSTYRPAPAPVTSIVNATILSAAGPRIERGGLVMRGGRIAAIGVDIDVPEGATVIDAKGRWLTPGIVDPHSHVGLNSSPAGANGGGSNEGGASAAGLWIENAIWPQDPGFQRAREAGVTTLMVLPGSGNLFNGRSVTLRNTPALSPQGMKFPGAPYGLKMACGENPTSGGPPGAGASPGRASGRAGAMLAYRNQFAAAAAYARRQGDAAPRDLALETVAGALNGEILVHIHCYRADEMLQMIDLAREYGFRIAAFHHALEAFKIAPALARERIAVATWAGDWSGYKMEAYDSIMENAAFVERAGGIAAMHSDDPNLIQHLNHEAARAMTAGREAGLGTTPEQAIRWITINPARIIGVADETGSLETGKRADVVLWSADPFSIYAAPDLVFIDGVLMHDRAHPALLPQSDFELGQVRRPARGDRD